MLSRASVTEVKLIVKKAVKRSSRPTEILGNQLKKKSKDTFSRCDYLRYLVVPGLYEELRNLRRKVNTLFGGIDGAGTLILNRSRFACPICESVLSLDDGGSLACLIKHLKNKHEDWMLASVSRQRWESLQNGDDLDLEECDDLCGAKFPGLNHPECCDINVIEEMQQQNNDVTRIKHILFEKVAAKVTSDYFVDVKEYLKK